MEGHALKKCVERYCELANKKVEQVYEVSSPCLDDHQFMQEELESAGEFCEVCSQIVLKCLYWHELDDMTSSESQQAGEISHKMDSNI